MTSPPYYSGLVSAYEFGMLPPPSSSPKLAVSPELYTRDLQPLPRADSDSVSLERSRDTLEGCCRLFCVPSFALGEDVMFHRYNPQCLRGTYCSLSDKLDPALYNLVFPFEGTLYKCVPNGTSGNLEGGNSLGNSLVSYRE